MKTHDELLSILSDWRTEPDPLRILELIDKEGLTDLEVRTAGKALEELAVVSNPDMGPMTKGLERVLSFFYEMYEELSEHYPRQKILFAGRDARLLFVFFRVLAHLRHDGTERFLQVPGSREFYAHTGKDAKIEGELLKDLGIEVSTIASGKKFVFIDTGFEGTVGLAFRKFVQGSLSIERDVTPLIPIVLLSNYTQNATIGQFSDYGSAEDETLYELRRYIHYKQERGITQYNYVSRFSRINDYIAIVLQNTPQYHGVYSTTTRHEGRVIAVSSSRGVLTADPPIYEINPDYINPVAALLLDVHLIRELLRRERNPSQARHKTFQRPIEKAN